MTRFLEQGQHFCLNFPSHERGIVLLQRSTAWKSLSNMDLDSVVQFYQGCTIDLSSCKILSRMLLAEGGLVKGSRGEF
jgi:hypothetical protein